MPAPLRITLTEEEDLTLSELRLAQTVPQRTRDRAHMLRLNAQGWNVPAIAEIFGARRCQGHCSGPVCLGATARDSGRPR